MTTRDFDWEDLIYAVVSDDGRFVGIPCTSWEEARELSNQHEDSHIFAMYHDPFGMYCTNDEMDVIIANMNDDEPCDIDDDCGFDPYMGEFTFDC